MIETIKGIKINGRCFKTDTSLLFYQKPNDRISIVYGKNGSGKSTISEGIASLSHKGIPSDLTTSFVDSNQQSLPLGDDTNVFVFNEKYIDENVKIDDDGLGTIVLLGGQVDLQAEIDSQEKRVNDRSSDLDQLSAEYSNYHNKDNPLCPEYHKSRITRVLKQDGGWAETDSQIKGNKIKSQVTDSIIKEIGTIAVKDTLVDLQNKFEDSQKLLSKISDSAISYPDEILVIKIDKKFEKNIVDLLGKKIDEPVLSAREKLILSAIQGGAQARIEAARNDFSQEGTKICPYCYQTVGDNYKHELVESINRVLNKDVDDHKAQLASIQFPIISLDYAVFSSLDSELSNSAAKQQEACVKKLEQYKELVSQKLGSIYTPISIKPIGLAEEVEKLNIILRGLEEKRLEFNDAAKKKSSIIRTLILLNKEIAHHQIAQLYKDYSKQDKDREAILKKLDEKQKVLASEKQKLTRLQQRKANIGLAIESINSSLNYVFLSQGRLSIELRNEKYYLKSNGEDVLPKKVSLGERNIIALCYFFTQILANQEIGKLYQNEAFVVIDDPVSSFDFENKVGIISLLRFQTARIIKENNHSKVLFLSHDLETVFSLKKAMEEICKSIKRKAGQPETSCNTLELHDTELTNLKNKHNEYGALLAKVYHYANGDKEDSLAIGNEMRRVLEAFSTFTYRKGIEDVSLDSNVLSALGNRSAFFENLMYRLVLHGESHYEEQVYSIRNSYNFLQFISEDEKRKTAKNILCFMYILNPGHILAYLQQEAGAVAQIKTWAKDIPDNQSFELEEAEKKRVIHLYSLPISAGVGKDSFEDIPYSDYETDNDVCDFALQISGDSMEPTIPNGSIVLIKKQETIDDKKVGTFLYNGRVYCKYLVHKDEKVYLCSFNSSYPPIEISPDDELIVYGAVVEVAT